jgi:hypothetical protein
MPAVVRLRIGDEASGRDRPGGDSANGLGVSILFSAFAMTYVSKPRLIDWADARGIGWTA